MVLEEQVEQVNLPDMVDVIVSEPMGYLLFNQKVTESFLYARKWLKPNGRKDEVYSFVLSELDFFLFLSHLSVSLCHFLSVQA